MSHALFNYKIINFAGACVCFELRTSAWMITAALLSTALGCGTISDAPHRSISTSAVLPAESLSDNPPVDEPQTDIPPLESSSAPIIAALSRNAGSFAAGNSSQACAIDDYRDRASLLVWSKTSRQADGERRNF